MNGITPERLQALCHLFRAASEKRVKAAASYSRGYITMAETIVPLENHTGLRAGDGPG